jgi:Fe-S oxidoreductase
MKTMFAPGCALMLYKPHLAEKLHEILKSRFGEIEMYHTCCRHEPGLKEKTKIINICPGCDKRFRNDYDTTTTISLWEILSESDLFPLPDYNGKQMSIIDACPTRDRSQVHEAIRSLLKKMNIDLVEPAKTRMHGTCCGDTFYGVIPTEKVIEQMRKRTSEMPVDDVVVYCVSCTKSVFNGGKKPHYIIDLFFNEATVPGITHPDEWHRELDIYIEAH